jgi:hypothetical protein
MEQIILTNESLSREHIKHSVTIIYV